MNRTKFFNLSILIILTFAIIPGCGGKSSSSGGGDIGNDNGIENGSDNGTGDIPDPPDADKDGIEDSFDNCPDLTNASQLDSDCDGTGDACTAPDTTDADCDFIYDGCDDNVDLTDADCDGEADGCVRPDLTDGDCDGVVDGCESEVCTEDPCSEICDNNPDDCVVLLDGDCDGVSDDCDDSFDDVDEDCDGLGDSCSDDVVDNTNSDGDDIFDGCDNCPDNTNSDQADSDCDGIGDACDLANDASDDDDDGVSNGCDPDYPELIPASILSVDSGCVTYVGDHPVEPEQGFVQTYQFCNDGTLTKYWNPDPVNSPALPGLLECKGTWEYNENQLTVDTTATVMGMSMVSVETYGVAFTYDNGAKLDMFSVAQVTPGNASTVIGSYALHTEVTVFINGMMDMLSVIDSDTDVTADAIGELGWVSSLHTVTTCTGSLCAPELDETEPDGGTLSTPVSLYDLNNGTYILQTNDNFVLERQ